MGRQRGLHGLTVEFGDAGNVLTAMPEITENVSPTTHCDLWRGIPAVPLPQTTACGAPELGLSQGALARLFMCVELLRVTRTFGDHPDLAGLLAREADRLVIELSAAK